MILLPLSLMAQVNIFSYHEEADRVTLRSDKDNIELGPSTKTKAGTVERLVNSNGHEYKFIVKKSLAGKVQEITDFDGTVRATVLLYGDNRYNVLLPNGELLKWNPKDKRHWSYQKNGLDIITGEYQKVHGQKQIEVQIIDPSYTIIPIIFLERTSHIAGSTYPTGVLVGLVVGLGIIGVAKASSGSN